MRAYELAAELRQHTADLVRAAGLSSHLVSLDAETEGSLRAQFPQRRNSPPPRPRRRRGPQRVTFEPPWDDNRDGRADLRYEPEWSTRDVAYFFGVKPATVRQWVRRGYISPSRSERGSHVFSSSAVRVAHEALEVRTNDRPGTGTTIRPKHYEKRISCAHAAALVKVAPSTVRSWIHRGHLAASRDETGHVIVRVGDVVDVARMKRHPTLPDTRLF
ncbi:MAG: MerR family transcriptional regulator [Actinomycetes bacterium]